jgi:putative ABC transport system permease protein
MLRFAFRGLLSRKLRAALTAFAVLLGVAMIAGTLMLNASVARSFDDIFSETSAGIDVSVRPNVEIDAGFDLPEAGTAIPADTLADVKRIEGVGQAVGRIGDAQSIAILDEDGDRIGPPQGGPPHIVNNVEPEPFNPYTYLEGEAPDAPGEVAIDSISVEEEGFEVGQKVTITGAEGAREYTLSGIAEFGSGIPLAGASLAVFTLEEAQRITG